MTRGLPVRLFAACAFVVLLCSCGGSGGGVDPAADASAASAAGHGPSSADSTTTPPDGGNPGAPAGSRDDSGSGATDVQAGGNPGAPGDVAVFEERGVSYAEFRDGSAQRVCVEEKKCTLAPPHDPEGVYSNPAECPIESMDYSTGTHRNAQGELVFLEGATVTVTVNCARFTDTGGVETTSGGTDGSGGTSSESSQSSDSGTSGEASRSAAPQG